MSAPASTRRRRPILALALVFLAVGLVCAVAAWRPWASASAHAAAGSEPAAAAVSPMPLTLTSGARVLVFGDSWTYGSAATPITDGYAYVLGRTQGWNVDVDGVRGSGYLKPGIDGGTYGERIAALDRALDPALVIIQGSINDRREGAAGYRAAVTAAWDALAALYPKASFVVLGPAPHVLPVGTATARIDTDLAALAAARGWWYVSPIAEHWITPANYASVIDTGVGRDHPSTAGHAFLARRLAADLARMQATTDASGDTPAATTLDR